MGHINIWLAIFQETSVIRLFAGRAEKQDIQKPAKYQEETFPSPVLDNVPV